MDIREIQRQYWINIDARRNTVAAAKPDNRRPHEYILREYERLGQEPRYAGEFLISPSLVASLGWRK